MPVRRICRNRAVPHGMTATGLEDYFVTGSSMLSARSKLATNTGLISGSTVLCEPDTTRH
jgi:hypothetical protein